MLKTRIIPVLLLKNGRMVKGKKFKDFRDVGDPVSAARIYNAQNADELIILDIDATHQNRNVVVDIIERVSKECFMPLAVGGGIRSGADIRSLLLAGADKVVITTAAVEDPEFIREAARDFGSQCIVAGIDVMREESGYSVWTHSGTKRTPLDLLQHVRGLERNGAGEIFVNAIDRDGMMCGYDLELAEMVQRSTSLPVIIAGGAGNFEHLRDAILRAKVHAVGCSSVFHFGDNNPIRARAYLKNAGIPMKKTK